MISTVLVAALSCGPGCRPADVRAPDSEPVAAQGSVRLILNNPIQAERPRNACEAEHCRALLEMIENAEETIDMAIYGLRDQTSILEALRAAKERGVKIRAIVDRDLEGNNIYRSTPELVDLLGNVHSDMQVDRKLTRQAARQKYDREPKCDRPEGLQGPLQCLAYDLGDQCLLAAHASREPLEGSEAIMHNKFFIVDGRKLWTGSTNISDSGTGGYNANLVTVVDAPIVAGWYTDEFEQMYAKGRYHTLKDSSGPKRVQLSDAMVEVYFSPQDKPIRHGVQPLLREAKESIDIAVFFLTHKHITADLIDAHLRGVKVRVILDATGAKNEYSKHEILRAAGIPVKVENWGGKMHMKSAVVDRRTVITGSMNWTSSGEFSNDENTIIVHSPELSAQYETFFDTLWESIPVQWLQANPDPESADSIHSCNDGSDNDFDDLVDQADPGCGDDPPPLPSLPPVRIVPKGSRLTCEVGM